MNIESSRSEPVSAPDPLPITLNRRDFNSVTSATLSVMNKLLNGSAATVSELQVVVAPLIDAIKRYEGTKEKIKELSDGFRYYHKARAAIAGTFNIEGSQVQSDPATIKLAVAALHKEQHLALVAATRERTEEIKVLLKHRTWLHNQNQLASSEKKCDLRVLSAALDPENAHLSDDELNRLIESENREILELGTEHYRDIGHYALTECNAFETRDGVRIYRQVDGSFSLTSDKRWEERWKAEREQSTGLDLSQLNFSFSPEMYRHSHLPPSSRSLEVQNPALETVLHQKLLEITDNLVKDSEGIPSGELALILQTRDGTCFDSIIDQGNTLLETLHTISLSAADEGRNPRFSALLKNPRAAAAKAAIGGYLSVISFSTLPERPNRLATLFLENRFDNNWCSPLQESRARKTVLGIMGSCVSDLIDQKQLFFCNHLISSFAEFRNLATRYSSTPEFCSAFLPVFAQLLNKGINPVVLRPNFI